MVGEGGGITDMTIVCTFEQDAAPEIAVHRGCIVRNYSVRKHFSLKCPSCGAPINATLNECWNRY